MYIKKIVLLFSFLFLSFLVFVNNIFADPVITYVVNDKEKLFGDVFVGDERGSDPLFCSLPEDLQKKIFGYPLRCHEHDIRSPFPGLPENWRFMGRAEEDKLRHNKLMSYVYLSGVELKEKQEGIVISVNISGVMGGEEHMMQNSRDYNYDVGDGYWTSSELAELRKSLVKRAKAIKGIELIGKKFIINDKKQLFGSVSVVNEGENIPEKLPPAWHLDDDYIYVFSDVASRKKELDGYLYIDKVALGKKGQDTIILCEIGSQSSLESSNLSELKKKIERLEEIEEIEIWIDPELERELSAIPLN